MFFDPATGPLQDLVRGIAGNEVAIRDSKLCGKAGALDMYVRWVLVLEIRSLNPMNRLISGISIPAIKNNYIGQILP
jgi:hypothetical protein